MVGAVGRVCMLTWDDPSGIDIGAGRGGFRGVPEVSRNHSEFSLDDGCAPFGYNVSRGIHSGLNSSVTVWLFFQLEVKEM